MNEEKSKISESNEPQANNTNLENNTQDGVEKPKTKPWYKQSWVIILSLILFFPVGLILTWLSDWKLSMKILATSIVVILFSLLTYSSITSKPVITIDNPKNNGEIETDNIDVNGSVNPAWAKLQVNNKFVELKTDGTFKTNVNLQEGENTIKISATNSGKTTETTLVVKRLSAAEILARKALEAAKKAAADAAQAAKEAAANAKATYQGSIVSYSASNPASLKFIASVKNTGNAEGKFDCKVTGKDDSNTYRGYDYFKDDSNLKPGETRNFNGTIVISNKGAVYVTQVAIDCK